MASPTPTPDIKQSTYFSISFSSSLSDKIASSLYRIKAGLGAGSMINITAIYKTAENISSILALTAARIKWGEVQSWRAKDIESEKRLSPLALLLKNELIQHMAELSWFSFWFYWFYSKVPWEICMIKSTVNCITLLYILNDDSEGKKKTQIVRCKICIRYSEKQGRVIYSCYF